MPPGGRTTPNPSAATFDFHTLDALRAHHPAWRLLRSDHAPFVAAFLHRVFVATNVRGMGAADLAEALEDELFALRQSLGDAAFPRSPQEYLDDWAAPDKGWLRKFYRPGTDEPQYDLTPPTEKAIVWIGSLADRPFVGTESRLLTLFALLEQIRSGSEADPAKRIAELREKRDAIDAEINRVMAGDVPMLDETAIRDRFLQFQQLARELLSDFREVEFNFRRLDRAVREQIALWEGSKGALLDEVMGEREAIAHSDQGRSFQAFWEFLMSTRRQEQLSNLLDHLLSLPAIRALNPDPRTRRVHHDWLEAGEHPQRTVAQLSQQLRRFLDDRVWLENRRIMDLLRGIEGSALVLREEMPRDIGMCVDAVSADVELPMERPLFAPKAATRLTDMIIEEAMEEIDTDALFGQIVIDTERLGRQIRTALRNTAQISLRELIDREPLQHGLAELIAYLQIGHAAESMDAEFRILVDEERMDPIRWRMLGEDGIAITREARLPQVIFTRAVAS